MLMFIGLMNPDGSITETYVQGWTPMKFAQSSGRQTHFHSLSQKRLKGLRFSSHLRMLQHCLGCHPESLFEW